MSLQRRVALPPLALGIHPAPLPKKKEEKKDEGKGDDKADKEKKPDDKPEEKGKEAKDGNVAKIADAANAADAPEAVASPAKGVAGAALSPTPASPGSMFPEPPTPGSDAPASPAVPVAADPTPIDASGAQVPAPQTKDKSTGDQVKDESKDPKVSKDSKDTKENKDANVAKDVEPEEPATPPPPIRLVGPVPPRPLRTKLDLNPQTPYPPINTDPRGAYYKYAKFNQGEWTCVDIVKDGWLAEQWREKPEREALARLRGESEAAAKREAERVRKMGEVRKVPKSAEAILLELWNDLVEAQSYEVSLSRS